MGFEPAGSRSGVLGSSPGQNHLPCVCYEQTVERQKYDSTIFTNLQNEYTVAVIKCDKSRVITVSVKQSKLNITVKHVDIVEEKNVLKESFTMFDYEVMVVIYYIVIYDDRKTCILN